MLDQRSADWFAVRCGRVTASRVADVMAKTKTGPSASRLRYAGQLIAERLTGRVEPSFSSPAMQWGTDTEAAARRAYEVHSGELVDEIAFAIHPAITMSGASPDGLVGAEGLVEIKCPETHTHLATLEGGSISGHYATQMQWQMACTGRAWCDFASFDPRLPEPLQLHVRRVHRDDAMIAELEREVTAFLDELAERVERLQSLAGTAGSKAPPIAA